MFKENEYYAFISGLDKSMALDIPMNGHQLVIREKHGENNQKFKISYHNGKYMIHCENGGRLIAPNNTNAGKVHAQKGSNSEN